MSALTAGRELDALIAETVMGLPRLAWDEHTRCAECGAEMRYCGARSRCTNCNEWRYSPYSEYSTEIAAAWLVVEKQNERFHARIDSPFEPGEDYFVGFTPHGASGWSGSPDYRAAADTAPLAICRAALACPSPVPPSPVPS